MEHKNKNYKFTSAFSLVEVILTMVFFAVIVLGIAKLQTSNLSLGYSQNLSSQAQGLMNDSLEIMEAIGYNTLNTSCAASCTRYLSNAGGTYNLSADAANKPIDAIFSRTLEITPIGIEDGEIKQNPANTLNINGYIVTAKIGWHDSAGSHSVQAKRIIYEN